MTSGLATKSTVAAKISNSRKKAKQGFVASPYHGCVIPKGAAADEIHPTARQKSSSVVEARVVRRLEAKLAKGPLGVFVVKGFLGNPVEGGCPADMAVVSNWEEFVKRNSKKFQLTGSGTSAMLGLVASSGHMSSNDELADFKLVVNAAGGMVMRCGMEGSLSKPTFPPAAATLTSADKPPGKDWVPREASPNAVPLVHVAECGALACVLKELQLLYRGCLSHEPQPLCRHMAMAFKGVAGNLLLLEVATPQQTYLFDTVVLGASTVCDALRPFLECKSLHKVVHDLHSDAAAFRRLGICLEGLLDSQLAYEHLKKDPQGTLEDVLRLCEKRLPTEEENGLRVQWRTMGDKVWQLQPLLHRKLECALLGVPLLAAAYPVLAAALGDDLDLVVQASHLRAKLSATSEGKRLVSFDSQQDFHLASYELLQVMRPQDAVPPQPITVDDSGTQALLGQLPRQFFPAACSLAADVTHIILDVGRRPQAYCSERRVFLEEDEAVLVTSEHTAEVVAALGPDAFCADNRASIAGNLHRITAVRSLKGGIVGLTLRVGRPVTGLAFALSDMLLGISDCSILFVGEPGSGKTAALRDVASLLSQWHDVMVVDTCTEIGGDGDVPHSCLGLARRLMVPSLDQQGEVMMECIYNHCPHVMVVDEIWGDCDVEAACVAKGHGVRLVAGVGGSLQHVLQNPRLRGLLGTFEDVTLPGGERHTRRTTKPVFECVVELRRGARGDWDVVLDVSEAVDCLLLGRPYRCQRRTRDPATGLVRCEVRNI